MSATIQVYLRDSKVPTVDDWNAAIKTEGFDLVLDQFDMRTDAGYQPAMLKDRESGFEWFLDSVADMEEDLEFPFKAHIGDCDLKADLSYTSYADEDVATTIAAAVLAKLTGGYFLDCERESTERFLQGDSAIAEARKIVKEWELRGPWSEES